MDSSIFNKELGDLFFYSAIILQNYHVWYTIYIIIMNEFVLHINRTLNNLISYIAYKNNFKILSMYLEWEKHQTT